MVNKIYVIGLARAMDRIERMQSRLHKQFTEDDYYLIAGVDGEECRLNPDMRTGFTVYPDWKGPDKWIAEGPPDDPTWSWWCREIKWGEVGCTLSHIGVWELANELSEPVPIVVLEDDAIICEDFGNKIEVLVEELYDVDPEWDLCYLGRERWKEDYPTENPNIVKPGFSFCTYGYMVSLTGLAKLADSKLKDHVIPIDEWFVATYAHKEHPRDRVKELVSTKLNTYALNEVLVEQEIKDISGSYTEQSRDVVS
tara:strand:+ start:33 stop:794 length:762 start_codon:yes stop_codon:yes gene_type:complete